MRGDDKKRKVVVYSSATESVDGEPQSRRASLCTIIYQSLFWWSGMDKLCPRAMSIKIHSQAKDTKLIVLEFNTLRKEPTKEVLGAEE